VVVVVVVERLWLWLWFGASRRSEKSALRLSTG
jgi:hypothetical protein